MEEKYLLKLDLKSIIEACSAHFSIYPYVFLAYGFYRLVDSLNHIGEESNDLM